jgi:hypothetical protein
VAAQLVALVDFQVSVVDCPALIIVGDADTGAFTGVQDTTTGVAIVACAYCLPAVQLSS